MIFNPFTGTFEIASPGPAGAPGVQGEPGQNTGAVLYFDSAVDGTIANYNRWVHQGSVTIAAEVIATAAGLVAGANAPFQISAHDLAFISIPSGVGSPAIQQGEWSFDLWLGVNNNNNNGTPHVEIDVYTRTAAGVETLRFTVATPVVTGVGPTLYQVRTIQPEFLVDPTDRVVAKFRAVKPTGGTATTVTLTFQGSTHPSHAQTALGQVFGGKLGSAIDGNGYAITNYDNGHTTADVSLGTDASTAVLAVVLSGLGNSRKLSAVLQCRVTQYTAADHAVNGPIDLVCAVTITTDASGVATVTLSQSAFPDTSLLPTALAGATAAVAASTGGFTISATRKAGTSSLARARWWCNRFEDLT